MRSAKRERCAYCGAHGALTVDHVMPDWFLKAKRLEGVFWLPTITALACTRCNSAKGGMFPWEFWESRATGVLPESVVQRRRAMSEDQREDSLRAQKVKRRGCQDCGAKPPHHFTRCTSEWAKQNAALGIASLE